MNLKNQIETLKTEVGKPNKNRGRNVRDAAIRFEETFRERAFNTAEFNDWLKSEPALEKYWGNSSQARTRLQAAGFRDDMPAPFEIVRKGMSTWELRSPQEAILAGEIPEDITEKLKQTERRFRYLLQACDIDALTPVMQLTIVILHRDFTRGKRMQLEVASAMEQMVLDVADSGFLTLPDKAA